MPAAIPAQSQADAQWPQCWRMRCTKVPRELRTVGGCMNRAWLRGAAHLATPKAEQASPGRLGRFDACIALPRRVCEHKARCSTHALERAQQPRCACGPAQTKTGRAHAVGETGTPSAAVKGRRIGADTDADPRPFCGVSRLEVSMRITTDATRCSGCAASANAGRESGQRPWHWWRPVKGAPRDGRSRHAVVEHSISMELLRDPVEPCAGRLTNV
jgi:hypothetical protein